MVVPARQKGCSGGDLAGGVQRAGTECLKLNFGYLEFEGEIQVEVK